MLLPPQIVSASQSAEQVPAGGTVKLVVFASDPQGSALTFSWTSSSGLLSAPTSGAHHSEMTWTAPACLAQGSVPVKVTVTNAHGLSSQVAFELGVSWDLGADHQPPFSSEQFLYLQDVTVTPYQTLAYTPHLPAVNPEKIVFPVDQRLFLSFVYESSGASHTLGWMYYDDLVSRGYVNPFDDSLVDANANGIADFHEDLYNLAPSTGPRARPYIGTTRRCNSTFTSGGLTYSQPELALNGSCANTFMAMRPLADARPGQVYNYIQSDVIGAWSTSTPGTGFSDRGLYPRIPNLLEPAAPANNFQGLGRLAFLLSDDDDDRETYKQLGAVTDIGDFVEGIPDYDVSAYDATGLPRAVNPDPGISPYDRSVDLGVVQGGREVVFFLVVQYDSQHAPMDYGTVYPCLRKAADGRCTLHLRTSTSVFFSKSRWNLDQDFRGTTPAAQRNMGCEFEDACNPESPQSYSCTVAGTTQRLCGWLDPEALDRLNTLEYGSLVLPMERLAVSASGNGNTPHLALAVPSTDPSHWLLGFEDLNGGGDRDYNDVVFRLHVDSMGAGVRSSVISGLSPDAAPQCRVSRVRFYKEDNYNFWCMPQPQPSPTPPISYAVATDCRVCSGEVCVSNPSPTWHNVPVGEGPGGTLLDLSTTPGTQLCWKADLNAQSPYCQLEVYNVDIGYELTPTP